MKDMTVVPPPAAPLATVESQFTRREPMDTTCIGASPSLAQDRFQVATLPSPASGSQPMDTSSFGAALLTQVPNSTQVPVQISLSPRAQTIELADIATQLQMLMSSMQSLMTTGWTGRRTDGMKNAENRDDEEFEEHDCFWSELALRDGAMVESGEPKLKSARHAPC